MQTDPVGLIGLGAMGTAYARRLLARGIEVVGFDPAPAAAARLAELGGTAVGSAGELAEATRTVITSLPSVAAAESVVAELTGIAVEDGWLIDTNTLLPGHKAQLRERLAPGGWTMLDCAVSGHPDMVVAGTATLYASGPARPERVEAVLAGLTGDYHDLGAFGRAATVKLLINHLVVCHDAVTAEAMAFADAVGLDRADLYDLAIASAGTSRIFEIRGRMMAQRSYPPATNYELIVDKDGPLIADLARAHRQPLPVFLLALSQHVAGMSAGWQDHELASMVEALAGRRPLS